MTKKIGAERERPKRGISIIGKTRYIEKRNISIKINFGKLKPPIN